MKKFFSIFMVTISILLLMRITFGNSRPLSLKTVLEETETHGEFFNYDDVFIDIQKIQWNFKGITNALTASAGSTYTTYHWVPGNHPAHQGDSRDQQIFNKQEIEVGHFVSVTEEKPAWSAWINEWLSYVSRFLGYIGSMFISIGGLLIDTFKCLIETLYKALMLIYYLCTT